MSGQASRRSKRRDRRLHSVAGKINPFQEMSYLVSADAECNLKNLRATYSLTHGGVEARASLLDLAKMKCRDVRDGLDMAGGPENRHRSWEWRARR